MDFAFSDEQEQLRAAARDYLADRYPAARVVSLADSEAGWDPSGWRELADLGWLDPDLGLLEHAVLAEETGNALLPAPWWSSIGLAWPLLDEELRKSISAGESIAMICVEDKARYAQQVGSTRLSPPLRNPHPPSLFCSAASRARQSAAHMLLIERAPPISSSA